MFLEFAFEAILFKCNVNHTLVSFNRNSYDVTRTRARASDECIRLYRHPTKHRLYRNMDFLRSKSKEGERNQEIE